MRRFLILSLCLVLRGRICMRRRQRRWRSTSSLGTDDAAVVGSTHITVTTQLDRPDRAAQGSPRWRTARRCRSPAPPPTAPRSCSPWSHRLVLIAQIQNIAKDMGLEASDSDIQKQIDDLVKQSYGGDKSKLQADLKKAGLSRGRQYEQICIRAVGAADQDPGQAEDVEVHRHGRQTCRRTTTSTRISSSRPTRARCTTCWSATRPTRCKAHQAVQNGEDWDKVAKQYSIPARPAADGRYLQGDGRAGRDQLRQRPCSAP